MTGNQENTVMRKRFNMLAAVAAAASMAFTMDAAVSSASAGDDGYYRGHSYHGGYSYKRHHYRGGHRYKRGSRHYHHHYYKRRDSDAAEAAAIIGGVVLGAIVLDSIIDDRRGRSYDRGRYYRSYSPPPAPPPQRYGYRSGYRDGYVDGRQDDGYRGASDNRAGVTYDYAFQTCLARSNRVLADQGISNAGYDYVISSEVLPDGAWRIRFMASGYGGSRRIDCMVDGDGVRALDVG